MQRLIAIVLTAVAGSSGGYLLHQVLSRKAEPAQNPALVIGAPVSVVLLAAVVGLVTGRRGPALALIAGLLGATFLGTRLDDAIPGVADARETAMEALNQRRSR